MAARRATTFAEGGSSSPLRIRAVGSNPRGYADPTGCAAPTSFGPNGEITGAIVELAAPYTDCANESRGHCGGRA